MKAEMNEREMLAYIETLKMELRETKDDTESLKSVIDSVKLSRNVFAGLAGFFAVAAVYLAWGVL